MSATPQGGGEQAVHFEAVCIEAVAAPPAAPPADGEPPLGASWLGEAVKEEGGRVFYTAVDIGGQRYELGEVNGRLKGRWPPRAAHHPLLPAPFISPATSTPTGDCIYLCSTEPGLPPYVARLESLHQQVAGTEAGDTEAGGGGSAGAAGRAEQAGGSGGGGGGMWAGVRWLYRWVSRSRAAEALLASKQPRRAAKAKAAQAPRCRTSLLSCATGLVMRPLSLILLV